MVDLTAHDAHEFITTLDEVDLSRFRVVGTYTRHDEAVRNALQDARQKILAGFEPPGRKRENHLMAVSRSRPARKAQESLRVPLVSLAAR